MVRPCRIRHLPMVYRLWGRGMSLDLRQALPGSEATFWPALAAALPGSSLWETVYVLERGDGLKDAFLQIRRRTARPEADLVYIAPTLEDKPEAREAWDHLLTGTCIALGQQGIERIYAGLPESGPEVGVFRAAGFVLYTREELFRLGPEARTSPENGQPPLQVRAAEHDWGLERLYNELVPWLVQQAEGGQGFNGLRSGFQGQESDGEYVLLDGDEIVGLVQMGTAAKADWLSVFLHPRAYHWARAIVTFGLSQLQHSPRRPVYCAVRHYQGGLRTPLEENGFQWTGTRALLVRHTVARVREGRARRIEGMEKRPEAAIPTSLGCRPPGTQQNLGSLKDFRSLNSVTTIITR